MSGSGMTRKQKYSVQHAKRRSDKSKTSVRFTVTTVPTIADVEMAEAQTPQPQPKPRTYPLSLPKELARPEYKEVPVESLQAIDPALANTDIEHIRDSLDLLGSELMQSLASVKVNVIEDKLPKELSITVSEATAILPTHLLAVFGKPSGNGPRKVTLYPVHSLVLASQCANLPKFPAALPVPLLENGKEEVQLPVFSICLPFPQSYALLSRYLYTKNIDLLLHTYLPRPPPPSFMDNRDDLLLAVATDLAATFTIQTLAKCAISLHGLWQNVCALGIFDDELWDAIDLMWQTLLTALAIATGKPGMMLDQSGQVTQDEAAAPVRAVL